MHITAKLRFLNKEIHMSMPEPKKLALLRIWQILLKHSDYDHPLTQEEIIAYLYKDYNIEMERKAIGKNIADLRCAGIEIGTRRGGSYIDRREFEDSELRLLIDGVLQSKHITAKHSKALKGTDRKAVRPFKQIFPLPR